VKRFPIADFRFWIGVPAVFIAALALGLLVAPVPSEGQQPGKVYRIGMLFATTPPALADTGPQHCPIKGNPYW